MSSKPSVEILQAKLRSCATKTAALLRELTDAAALIPGTFPEAQDRMDAARVIYNFATDLNTTLDEFPWFYPVAENQKVEVEKLMAELLVYL